ncbi:MAG: RNA polymerase-associated protein RapA [Bacteroidales bacterium]|nr:RNA polymerase-associated protein RapA [Bacteroidales bacterium]
MGIFFPNQRYTSEGEPELGVGILTETSKGRVQIHFPISDETRLYALENAPLRRVIFKPGDTITDTNKQALLIERVEQADNLYIYYGNERTLSEAELGEVSVIHGADDKLFTGDVDSPEKFALRRETLLNDHKRRISPVNGFVGGRIDLIPHQLYIAHEVSSRYAPRVLLSDQVGLGKTIEACLILHRLLLSGRISRVLILVPESLIHQWFVEVLRRFNLWFNIFDEERCDALDDNAPDGNPFLDDQLIICSTEFLAGSEKRTRQALSASWDMLVVDEAHHLEWSVDKVSPEYAVVELLSKVAKGLLLLTATPEQLGQESHFARLRLLDPSRYDNYDDFKNESTDHKNIANIVESLSLGKDLKTKETKLLESIFSKKRIESLSTGGDLAKNNLIEDLLDQHGPGRVLFRNSRLAISGFPKRKAHLIPLKVTDNQNLWVKRLRLEFNKDMGISPNATDRQQFWFAEDPRVVWLKNKMKEIYPAKALLICKSKEKVLALEKTLAKVANLKLSVFHEDLTIVQRDRNAAWFSETDGARLLLCSEIGSEGRNFQFAHHLILFDLPFHPELLEQRIGRLDRIGQTKDIHLHIPYLEESPQHILVRWFHEGLNAFEENLEGGNKISKLFSERILTIFKSVSSPEADNQLDALINDTSTFQKELKISLANGRDRLLEMNSFRPEVAKKLVKQIQTEDRDKSLENYITKVFEHFNVEMEDLAPRTYLLHPAPSNTKVFPSVPHEGISVTFDRKRALSREDVSFLSWDHPMTTTAIDMVLSSETGSASYGVLRKTGSPGLLLELLFVLETAGKQSIYVDQFLPNTMLRIVVDHTGNDVTDKYSVETFNKSLIPGQIDDLLDNETLVETILPNMISTATKIAEERASTEISKGLQRMILKLDHEIERLKILHKKNKNIRPEEIEIALKEKTTLATLIKDARVRMDALQLIRKE